MRSYDFEFEFQIYRRCDDDEIKRTPIFKQLLDIADKKKSKDLIEKLSSRLRTLLVGTDADDFTDRILRGVSF